MKEGFHVPTADKSIKINVDGRAMFTAISKHVSGVGGLVKM